MTRNEKLSTLLIIGFTAVSVLAGFSIGLRASDNQWKTVMDKSPTPIELKKNIDATKGAYLTVGYMAGTTLEECREIKNPTPEQAKDCEWAKHALAHTMKGTGVDQLGEIAAEK